MLRLLLPLFFALGAPLLTAQPTEPLKGLLWEISGNGIAKKGYLYGTMHVPEKMAFNLSDSFFVALRAVDVVALETDHDYWQAFTEILEGQESNIFGDGDRYGGGYRPRQPNLYHEQFNFSVPENRILGAMLSAKPRLSNEFLYRTNQYRQDHEEDTYLDLFIFQAGRKLGKTVIGLETLEGSFEAMIRSQLPNDEDEEEERRRYAPPAFSRSSLEDAYRDQDLSLLDSISRMAQPGKNFRRWMLDERNYIMANGIDSVLQSGSAIFAAVGAAHLPGETGLIPLLREKGYTVRPVQFSAETAKREKEAIEAMRHPVQFARQWAADSTWSAEAPGKFYQTIDNEGFEQYLCADMNNGAYYAVYRLRTYGLWNGQSPEYIAQRMDSLLYEKVPGRILERRRLNGTGIPGHEITTRTRRGDILRFKILVLPMDIYVFAAGGNSDYASGEEATRFLGSIAFRQTVTARRPTVVQPERSGFRVSLPVEPVLQAPLDKKSGQYLIAAADPADSACYLIFRGVYHDWTYIEEDTFELNIIGEKIAEQFTKNPPKMTWVAEADYPTQDVLFQSDRDSAWYHLRLVIHGPHYYLLGCRKPSPAAPQAFWDSFVLEPDNDQTGWEMLRDTGMQFEVLTRPEPEPPGRAFIENLKKIVQEAMENSKRGRMYGSGDRQPRQSRVLHSPQHGEEVYVSSLELLSGVPAPTLDSFQAYIIRRETEDGKMAVREQRWENPSERLLVGDLLLEDTNSVRGIRTRVFLTPGRLYILSATVHLGSPAGAFVEQVFRSFTPTDTTSGELPFGRRNQDFLKDLYTEDSLVREKALDRLNGSWLMAIAPSDFPVVRQVLEHPKFGQLRFKHRRILLGALGKFPTSEALTFAQHFWAKHPDSVRYQQLLLIAMAEMQTRSAHDALVRLLKQETVFVASSTITDVFSALSDSVELSARLLPDLLAVSDMRPECREPVIQLLEQATARNLVKPAVYARMKSRLIFDAYQDMGAMQAQAESKNEESSPADYYLSDYGLHYESDADVNWSLRLLVPFLAKDKAVQTLFDRATRCPDEDVQILAHALLLRQGRPVKNEVLRAYADADKTRYLLYRQLAETDQLARYAAWFADTTNLARSILYRDLTGDRYGESSEVDSIRFLSRHHIVYDRRPTLTYFFDVKRKKDKEWCLAYVSVPIGTAVFAVPDKPKNPVYFDSDYRRPEVRLLSDLSEKDKAEFIEKQLGSVRFADRERYQHWSNREEMLFEWEE